MIVFRSLWIPLQAAAMNLLSIGASMGIVVAVFQWGWLGSVFGVGAGPIAAFLPVMVFAIVFGLSMDYEVFLVSRIHEEWTHGADSSEAVREGLIRTGRVITAAAAVMVAVFASFMLGGQRVLELFGLGARDRRLPRRARDPLHPPPRHPPAPRRPHLVVPRLVRPAAPPARDRTRPTKTPGAHPKGGVSQRLHPWLVARRVALPPERDRQVVPLQTYRVLASGPAAPTAFGGWNGSAWRIDSCRVAVGGPGVDEPSVVFWLALGYGREAGSPGDAASPGEPNAPEGGITGCALERRAYVRAGEDEGDLACAQEDLVSCQAQGSGVKWWALRHELLHPGELAPLEGHDHRDLFAAVGMLCREHGEEVGDLM